MTSRKWFSAVLALSVVMLCAFTHDGVALVTETDQPTTKGGTFAFWSTEVWVRRGNAWKLVHLHYSALAEKQ